MRIKLEVDRALGLPDDFSKVWFLWDMQQQSTIGECIDAIRTSFSLGPKTLAISLDGFRLLTHQLAREFLIDGCTLHLFPSTNSKLESPGGNKTQNKNAQTSSPPLAAPPPPKKRKLTEDDQASAVTTTASAKIDISATTTTGAAKQTSPTPNALSSKPMSNTIVLPPKLTDVTFSTPSAAKTTPTAPTPPAKTTQQVSSTPTAAQPTPTAASPSVPNGAPANPAPMSKSAKKRAKNAKKRQLEQSALSEVAQNVNRFYINYMASKDNPTTDATTPAVVKTEEPPPETDYESLPRISLNQVKIGQIVAWRLLALSPRKTAELAPWQERQLVDILSNGHLMFRSHNINNYLSSYWYDDDGVKLCTVREWIEKQGEDNPTQVTIPVEFRFGDLRLVHNAGMN